MVCRGAQCSADDGDRREERNSTDATTKWNHSARDPRRVLGTRAYQRVWQAGGVDSLVESEVGVRRSLRNFRY
jgi:hypothetical protein